MEGEWIEVSLGELFKVKHGFAFKGEYFTDDFQKTVLVTPGNFSTDGEFKKSKPKYYNGPVPDDYRLRPGQVVVTMTDLSKAADTLGYAARIPEDDHEWLHNQRIGLLEFGSKDVDPLFISYLMRSRDYRSWVVGSATGTTVKHTSPKRILAYACLIPPYAMQQAISGVLVAFDKKIELNRQTNETLEAMAQALFKSWFVDFDPVIDNALAVGNDIPEPLEARAAALQVLGDARKPLPEKIRREFPDEFEFRDEMGWVPRGWRVSAVEDLIAINPRVTLKKAQDAIYADMKSLPTSGFSIGDLKRKPYAGGAKFVNGDVLLARITPCLENGKTGVVDFLSDGEAGFGSTEFIVLRGESDVDTGFVASLSRLPSFRRHCVQSMVGSSGRQRVQNSCFSDYFLCLPFSGSLLRYFNEFSGSCLSRTKTAQLESDDLAAIRDTLLPKLLSGELTLPDAEKLAADVL